MEVPNHKLTFVLKKTPQNFEDFRSTHSSDMDISDQSTPDRNVVEKVEIADHIESRRSGRPHKPNALPDFVQGKEATIQQAHERERERAKPTTLQLQPGKRRRGRPRKDVVTHCESLDHQHLREETRNMKKTAGLVLKRRSLEAEKRSIYSPPTTATPLSDPCGKSVKPNALSFSLAPNTQSPSFWNPRISLHNLPGSVPPCNSDYRSNVSLMNSSLTHGKFKRVKESSTTKVLTPETVPTMQNSTKTCDQIVSKVCDYILGEDDDICIIKDASSEKSVKFQDEKLNGLYNRICSRYGYLQGCQKVNNTVYMNLTVVLQVVSEMEMVDITNLKYETISNWESAITVGKHLKFKISWLEDKLNELKEMSKRPCLKEAMGNALELVSKLEMDFAVAKKNFEIAKEKMESLNQEKRDAMMLLDNATASYQESNTFQLNM